MTTLYRPITLTNPDGTTTAAWVAVNAKKRRALDRETMTYGTIYTTDFIPGE